LVPTTLEHFVVSFVGEFMMNRLLALGCAFVSTLAFGDIKSCDVTTNWNLQSQFYNRSFDGFFRANGNEIKTRVTFKGDRGEFKRDNQGSTDVLECVRYLTVEEALSFAQSRNAAGIDVSIFDTSSCGAAILADWVTGGSRGRVLWCAPFYSSGAKVEGIYWQDTNWELDKFTDVWEGRWQ
jgi:hypothetical protein